jgi:hypothetical protein
MTEKIGQHPVDLHWLSFYSEVIRVKSNQVQSAGNIQINEMPMWCKDKFDV